MTLQLFDRTKRNETRQLQDKIKALRHLKNPRQAVKDKILALERQLDDINPFVSLEAEQKFWDRMEKYL